MVLGSFIVYERIIAKVVEKSQYYRNVKQISQFSCLSVCLFAVYLSVCLPFKQV